MDFWLYNLPKLSFYVSYVFQWKGLGVAHTEEGGDICRGVGSDFETAFTVPLSY